MMIRVYRRGPRTPRQQQSIPHHGDGVSLNCQHSAASFFSSSSSSVLRHTRHLNRMKMSAVSVSLFLSAGNRNVFQNFFFLSLPPRFLCLSPLLLLYWLRTRGTRESRGWKYANVGCEQQPREWNSDCTIFFFFRFRWFAFSFSRRLGNRPPTVKAERRLAWKNEERVGQLRPSQFSQTIYTVPKQLKGRERVTIS